jgi:peroxiredoxin
MTIRNACRLLLILMLATISGDQARAADEAPIGRGVGRPIPNFSLPDVTSDREVSLYGFRGKKAAVLVFTGIDCPISDLYMPRLVELARSYEDKGVVFLAINSNAQDTAEQVAAHARTFGVGFPVLKDAGNRVADLLLAERTCEALVLDGSARLRYRGAIDDQYGVGSARKDRPVQDYLVKALDAVLAGREVDTTATSVVGCLIEKVEPAAVAPPRPRIRPAAPEIVAAWADADEKVEVGQVTYAADVAPILQNKCQACHRPGQVGPFSLLSYDDARRRSAMLGEVVEDRRMPPWHADPRHGHFENDRSLSPQERATLLAWVEQGAPLGDTAVLPAPRRFPEGWTIGQPDVVFEIPEPYTVAAQGTLPYQRFRVSTHFHEDKWIQAAEARPGDRAVVHHIIVYVVDPQGDMRNLSRAHLCGYAPGDMPSIYPGGTAKKIPAGSDLVFEIHYTPNGKVRTDRSAVGLIFAREPVMRQARTIGIAQPKFAIPPGDDNYRVDSSFTFRDDARLLSFMPHMHLRGKDFNYTAHYPDGTTEVLLSVPAYDFGWQSYYRLAEPKPMPRGTRIDCVAHYDNSAGNLANPDPTKTVRWGEQTWEEMMIGYIDADFALPNGAAPAAVTARKPTSSWQRVVRVLTRAAGAAPSGTQAGSR